MPTVRERLDTLTTKLWTSIDAVLDNAVEPDANSIAASNTAIDASVDAIDLLNGVDNPIPELNAQIAAITAIPSGSRTQDQKDKLALLRIVKNQHNTIVSLLRGQLDNRRRIKTLQRAFTVVGRFAMFLDGGTNRVRQGDIDGTE